MPEVETRYGLLTTPDAEDDVIGRFLKHYGEWAWLEAMFVASVIVPRPRVLDVGAFVGTFSLGLAMLCEPDLLCCVEGNLDVSGMLAQNVARRIPGKAVIVEAVVAGDDASVERRTSQPGNLGSTSFGRTSPDARGSRLPSTTLAALFAEHGGFDLVKLDVEGMEFEILESGAAYLSGGGVTLWVECNEDRQSLDLARLLLSWGLPVHYFAFPSHNPRNHNRVPNAVFPWAFEAGLLAAPRSPPALTPELAAAGCVLTEIRTVNDLREAMWRTPRWGRAEWEHAATARELAALVGRALREQAFDTFLESGTEAVTIWQRLDDALSQRSVALDVIEAERRQRTAVEAGLAEASALAIERMSRLDWERERNDRLEAELARVSARALAHLASIGEVRDTSARLEDSLRKRTEEVETSLRLQFNNWREETEAERRAEYDARQNAVETAARATVEASRQHAEAAGEAARIAVEASRQEVAEANEELARQRQQTEAAEAMLAAFETSTLWRVTAPVRNVVDRFRGKPTAKDGSAGAEQPAP